MKRLKIILLTSIILYSVLINSNNVYAVGNVNLTCNKSKCTVDDEFIVNVNISNMSVATLTLKINIDTNKVQYVSGPQNSNYINGRVIYTWTDPSGGLSPKTSGTIASFKFKAKIAGTASFTVSGDFYDQNENAINPIFSGTNIIVEAKQVDNQSGNGGNNAGGDNSGTNNSGQTEVPSGGNNNTPSGGNSSNVANNEQNNENHNNSGNLNNNQSNTSTSSGGSNNTSNGNGNSSNYQGSTSLRKYK